MSKKIGVLFVCHGNICRSPMAESYFSFLVQERGYEDKFFISSAATHRDELGNPPHRGTREKLAREHIPLIPHRARLLVREDGGRYDFILGMDEENMWHMRKILGDGYRAQVMPLLSYAGERRPIADPWYTGNFDETFSDIGTGCEAFLDFLIGEGYLQG